MKEWGIMKIDKEKNKEKRKLRETRKKGKRYGRGGKEEVFTVLGEKKYHFGKKGGGEAKYQLFG